MCLFLNDFQAASRWPLIAKSQVELGGVRVTCEEALRAVEVLSANGGTAIRAVLAAARSPLAACDYHAVYRPGLPAAKAAVAAPGQTGPAGRRAHRHLAKHAFALAVRQAVAVAACEALEQVLESFAADERYASAIAAEAVTLAQRLGRPRGGAVVSDSDSCTGTDAIAA